MATVNELMAQRITNAQINVQTWGGLIFNVKAFQATGDGTTDDSGKISDAVTAASVKGGTVVFPPGTYRVASNLTIPSNVTLWFMDGAILSVDNDVTVTINGPIQSGLYQIFSGNGTITGRPLIEKVYPEWWGAVGDKITDDQPAIQKAVDFAGIHFTVFLTRHYKIDSTITISSSTSIDGEGELTSYLYTENNIPMITINVTRNIDSMNIQNIGFFGNVTGTRTSNAGILITGVDNFSLNYSNFKNLLFQGTYYGIHSTKSTDNNGENMLDWNKFNNLTFKNNGSLVPEYGIKFDYGSGTGNIFSNMVIGAVTSCIEMGGLGTVNIGDLIFSNLQCNSAVNGIKIISVSYGSNISVTSCQFDAGITNSLNFNGCSHFTIQGCNWGGATNLVLTNCSYYRIDGKNNLQSNYGISKTIAAAGGTVNLFKITLPASSDNGLFIELVSFGTQQGKGPAITTTTYHIFTDGVNAQLVQLTNNQSGQGTAALTHNTSLSGNVITFSVTTNATNSNSLVRSNVRVVGGKYSFDVL